MNNNKYSKIEFNETIVELHNDKSFNPYLILNIPETYTEEQLKQQYRLYSLKTHPDKGGNPEHFTMVSKAYIYLLKSLKDNLPTKPIEKIKEEFNDTILEQTLNQKQNIKLQGDFDISRFNDVFSEYHINTDINRGYDEFLKETPKNNISEHNELFSDNFNISLFNKMFKEHNKEENINRQMVKIVNPEEMKCTNGYELGVYEVNDFSRSYNISECNSNGLDYTDIKVAYTTSKLVDEDNIKVKEWKNLEELQKSRKDISYKLSEEDELLYKQRQYILTQQEKDRLNIIKIQDEEAKKQFNKVNKMLLKN